MVVGKVVVEKPSGDRMGREEEEGHSIVASYPSNDRWRWVVVIVVMAQALQGTLLLLPS